MKQLVILVSSALILASCTTARLPSLSQSTLPTSEKTESPTSVESKPLELQFFNNSEFKYRSYDPEKEFMIGTKYPAELTSIQDTDLIKLRCYTSYYDPDQSAYVYRTGKNQAGPIYSKIPDAQVTTLFSFLDTLHTSKTVDGFYVCQTETNILIASELVSGVGGGVSYVSNIAALDLNEKAATPKFIGRIVPENMVYYGCRDFLQISKRNKAYVGCGGGDGPGGVSGVYSLDLTSGESKKLIMCSAFENVVTCEPKK